MRRLFARKTILCALGLLPGSILVMARLPPLWRDTDGLFAIASPPGHVTLLGFPALYPFLSRLPILLVSAWRNMGHLRLSQLGVRRWVALNDAGLLLLVAGQQLALIFALALLTVTCTKRPVLRCLIVVVFLCNPVLFIGAQLISTEALATILLILLITIAVELSRRVELSRDDIIALGVCLYANQMTRHLVIQAALMPMAYLLGAIAHVKKSDEAHIYVKKFGLTCAVGLVAIVVANLTTRSLCIVFHEPYRSTVARTLISRLDFIDRLPAVDRTNYVRRLQANASDPNTKEAIPAILAAKGYWGGSIREIERLMQSHGEKLTGKKLHARADHYLEEICILYYRSLPRIALEDIRNAIIRSLASTTPTEVLRYLYADAGVFSLKIYRSDFILHQRTAHLKSCSPVAEAAIKRAETTFWLRGLDKIPCGITLALLLAIATILRLLERFDPNMLSLLYALAIIDVLLMIGTFALTLYLPRYVLPSCVINAAAVAILLGGVTPPSHQPSKRSSSDAVG